LESLSVNHSLSKKVQATKKSINLMGVKIKMERISFLLNESRGLASRITRKKMMATLNS